VPEHTRKIHSGRWFSPLRTILESMRAFIVNMSNGHGNVIQRCATRPG
jgi:hypothetical protein